MSTLSDLIALIAADLGDPELLIWSSDDLTRQIRRALAQYSVLNPRPASALRDALPDQREYDIADLGALALCDVWCPYDPDHPAYPPPRVPFSLLNHDTFYIESEPAPTGLLRLLYLAPHTLAGLDDAAETTLDASGIELIILLATASAALQRAQAAIGKVTLNGQTPQQLLAWAAARQASADRAWQALRQRLALSGDPRISWEIPL